MKAPERIWADPPSLFDGVDLWHEKQDGAELTAVEYIRKDASDAAVAAARAEGVREGMLGLLEDDNLRFVMGQRVCCNGRDCGCMGADVQSYLEWLATPAAEAQP